MVRELYQRLHAENWIDPWLDEEKLLPGQDWDLEIERAVEASDAVIVCISSRSVTKEGYVQKELRRVLDIALEKPEETIFIIPLRLDDCELPRRLRSWHYVDFFPEDQRNRAYQRLGQSLNIRFRQLQSTFEESNDYILETSAVHPQKPAEKVETPREKPATRPGGIFRTAGSGDVDIAGSVLMLIYFAMAALDGFAPSDDTQETLLAVSAILVGISLLRKRQIPAGVIFKVSLIVYILFYGLGYRLETLIAAAPYIASSAAVLSGVMVALSVRQPKAPVFYSSISFAGFLFLVGIFELVTNFSYSDFTNTVEILIMISSIVTAILLSTDL